MFVKLTKKHFFPPFNSIPRLRGSQFPDHVRVMVCELVTIIAVDPAQPFQGGRLLAAVTHKPFDQPLGILGPELDAEPRSRDRGVVILAVHEARVDRRQHIGARICLRLRRVDRLGIAMVPGSVLGKVYRLDPRPAVPFDGCDPSLDPDDRTALSIFELKIPVDEAPLNAVALREVTLWLQNLGAGA